MLRLASTRDWGDIRGVTADGTVVYKEHPEIKTLTTEEKAALLVRQYRAGGRGSHLALLLCAFELIAEAINQEVEKFQQRLGQFPTEMLKLSFKAAAMGVRGEDVPPPLSEEFKNLTARQYKLDGQAAEEQGAAGRA